MFLLKLLSSLESSSSAASGGSTKSKVMSYVMIGGFILLIVVFFWYSSRNRKKQQQQAMDMLNSIKVGTKVETIGGVFGVVVEICDEDNTVVLETGSDSLGKTYIRFDKKAIGRIEPAPDAVQAAPVEAKDEAPEFEKVETAEETLEEKAEDSAKEEK
ncbi:MAG: preprotein translocase subunit YajC [Clostridia bacterium]|nr:preprotein translocase subunit YajC [Clostridia bacterium]